ncbi:3-ketoacyl-ACP reductase [Pseudomonas sp. HMWF032]|uniref:SDR family NAD(P)-dependent oxidoreductase n=1 Tax=Pseudomonas sp. HMWF032 TaxID=2056866 RepID=UPI000D3D1339|nr:SDR family oxidoreductase [Pseudomonas sp. HMWF032]PTS86474.1 3-ketoacyl-ACP reductase [Pseudomonas sp. HMWF032]PTT81338.1 3-ketoacyl-ACP reductase [Pseudomonas sp. HMWF010]
MNFLVTGGSRGIGRRIVEQALLAGHDVAFTWNQDAEAAAALQRHAAEIAPQRRCLALRLDMADGAAIDAVCEEADQVLDGIDVLVGNAAINRPGLAVSLPDGDWRAVMEVNLDGNFRLCRTLLPGFIARRRGRIVLISSVAAHGMSGQIAYNVSKAGLIAMAATLAREYGRRGITANALVLGLVDTDMSRETAAPKTFEHWLGQCPTGRLGTPDDVAQAVLYLASDGASFINGQAIHLTGGLNWVP